MNMENDNFINTLSGLSDEAILEEAANRLQTQFAKENGVRLHYGTFRFVFHDGRFQGVEDWPRNKRYVSPERFKKSSDQSR
jgi:hypothetical protein